MEQYTVTGMSCAACQARVEKAVCALEGVESCSVSLLTNSMGVEGNVSASEVIRAVENAGYGASLKGVKKTNANRLEEEEEALKDHETPKLKKRFLASLGFLIVLMYLTMGHHMLHLPIPSFLEGNYIGLTITQMILAAIVMIINHRFFTSGFSSLLHGAPNMDTLVALGSAVSYGWSVWVFYEMSFLIAGGAGNTALHELYHNELYFESAAMIPALITVGKMLEAMSKGRTTDALRGLLKLAPKTAVIVENGIEREIGIEELQVNDIFAVKPGESIPADGVIIAGETSVNEAALTGESIPVDKGIGDRISAATINTSGYIQARALCVGEDTALSKIIKMVSDAAATKAPIARIADRVSGIFVPSVIAIAVITVIGWLLAGQTLAFALARGISVLVISCPCALGLATPVAIMVGNGVGARNGILFKTSEALETCGSTQIIALDKTGTITEGTPKVTDVIAEDPSELIRLAAALERGSEHPLAKAVVEYADERKTEKAEAERFQALAGSGLKAAVEGEVMYGGSQKFISSLVRIPESYEKKAEALSEEGKTPLFFVRKDRLLGMIAVADVIRADSAAAIEQLRNMGIEVVMLTGDNRRTAAAIGKEAGVDSVKADVLPDGKEQVIRELKDRGKTAMVGDGINDAPALTRADTGIAIGAGTDIAIDSADVVLMNSRLSDAAGAVRLSRATLRNIYENLFWAFFYNLICIPLAAGLFPWKMNPMIGAAAMSLSSFTVCMNALRLNLFDIHDSSKDRPLRKRAIKEAKPQETADEKAEEKPAVYTEVIPVRGMMCEHCETRVRKALEKIDGVIEASCDHTKGEAVLVLDQPADRAIIKQAVEEAGYEVTEQESEEKTMEKVLQIEGMMCPHCEAAVKKALEALDGVVSAEADHVNKCAKVTLSKEVSDEALKEAVEAKDYKVTGIRA